MPKQLIANRVQVQAIRFIVDGAGVVSGLEASCEVNYGSVGLREIVDIWASLNPSQKNMVQSLYNAAVAKLNQDYLV